MRNRFEFFLAGARVWLITTRFFIIIRREIPVFVWRCFTRLDNASRRFTTLHDASWRLATIHDVSRRRLLPLQLLSYMNPTSASADSVARLFIFIYYKLPAFYCHQIFSISNLFPNIFVASPFFSFFFILFSSYPVSINRLGSIDSIFDK